MTTLLACVVAVALVLLSAGTILIGGCARDQIESEDQIPAADGELRSLEVNDNFFSSGWMGDGELGDRNISLYETWRDVARADSLCTRIIYNPGPAGWAGIYWQNEPDNWGDEPGIDLSRGAYERITFWAKGKTGTETIEFGAGGIDAPAKRYRDSFQARVLIRLDRDWKQYAVGLEDKDLSSVIGGFLWVASTPKNPNGLEFYLDDIRYEAPARLPKNSP